MLFRSDDVVMQEKDENTTVTWGDYQHLRHHLTGAIEKQAKTITSGFHDDLDGLHERLGTTEDNVTAMQQQLATLQTSINTLQATVETMRTTVDQHFQQYDDAYGEHDGSMAGDNQPQAPHGRGLGAGRGNMPLHGRGFAPLGRGAQRVAQQANPFDALSKPKFQIPSFEGSSGPDEYLDWEIKMDKLWRLHECTEERKVKLAASEFEGYSLRWWDAIVKH